MISLLTHYDRLERYSPFLPVDSLLIHEFAGLVKVIDRNTNMAEALGLVIAVMVDLTFLLLSAVIPCKL
jgi:hypothetical protein